MKTRHLVMLAALAASACGGASSPTAPSGTVTPQALPAQTTVSLGATGQIIAGRFSYWVRLGVAAGAKDIVITRIDFRYPESAQASPFTGWALSA